MLKEMICTSLGLFHYVTRDSLYFSGAVPLRFSRYWPYLETWTLKLCFGFILFATFSIVIVELMRVVGVIVSVVCVFWSVFPFDHYMHLFKLVHLGTQSCSRQTSLLRPRHRGYSPLHRTRWIVGSWPSTARSSCYQIYYRPKTKFGAR